jgi:hypothetical protein
LSNLEVAAHISFIDTKGITYQQSLNTGNDFRVSVDEELLISKLDLLPSELGKKDGISNLDDDWDHLALRVESTRSGLDDHTVVGGLSFVDDDA